MAGSVGPFVELGVGFDMELAARENVVVNGAMLGLTLREEPARRFDDPSTEFAELEEFADLKLKNYSSGMLVRLAFSVMVQADPDILLIDEVLAVGDASFQRKCFDTFREMRREGKTIVLVTHDMTAVEDYCHRAMLLSDGQLIEIGDPGDVARRYLQVNFEQRAEGIADTSGDGADVRILDVWLEDDDRGRVANIEQAQPIRICARLEARRAVPGAQFGFVIANADDVVVHEFMSPASHSQAGSDGLASGQSATLIVEVRNQLNPGRYYVNFGVSRHRNRHDVVLYAPHVLRFVIFGDRPLSGVVAADHEFRVDLSGGSLR